MTSGKQRGYAFDVDAWIQFHLLRLASFHPGTTKADLAVLAEIIQRYWGKFGNGWVTHEALSEIAGISMPTVKRAKKNLERLGFITVVQPGRRGSATVYKPNFDLVPQKGITDDTKTNGIIGDTETGDFGIKDDTETGEYGITDDTPSYLPDRPTRAESQIDRNEFAAPGAPPLAGLSAATAGPAKEGGFDQLWKAYSYKQKKAEAKAAYVKLAPDTALHDRMVDAAGKWFARWAAQEKPDAPRFTLAKWIKREEFECEPPTAYQARERKAKVEPVKPAAEVSRTNDAVVPQTAAFRNSRVGTRTVDIIETDVIASGRTKILTMVFRERDRHEEWKHEIIFEHYAAPLQERGQRELKALCVALGLREIDDSSELHAPVSVTVAPDGALTYAPAPSNDNQREAA